MSLSLCLCPQRKLNEIWMLARTCLAVENDGWQHCVRESDLRKPLPDTCEFEFYTDDGLIEVTESPNGEPITWMTANELINLPLIFDDEQIIPLPLTQAAIAYLKALDGNTPVILYFGS